MKNNLKKDEGRQISEIEELALNSLTSFSTRYYLFVGTLLAVILWAAFAYFSQLTHGLVVTGMGTQVFWGVYVSSFIFFIGISHAGTLIAAILQLTGAEWRKPIVRMAEAITVFALIIAVALIIIDLGRPDRMLNMLLLPQAQSPLIWDLGSVMIYLLGSVIFLYIALIPDLAILRDNLTKVSSRRKWIYGILSLGWSGSEQQKKRLKRATMVMAIIIIPIAVSVHTVVSWVFAVTLRTGWHTGMFGPYFVTGAIFSGIATLIIVMAIFRRIYHLEQYLQIKHFKYLGYMLITLNLLVLYFQINENFTMFYGGESEDIKLLASLTTGQFSTTFWSMYALLLAPIIIVSIPKTRTIKGITIAAISAGLAMWVERFLIVVPTLSLPFLVSEGGIYSPTWVEWSIISGAFATFILLLTLFSKVFPIVSIWEIKEAQSRT
ncbi:NrfD/PsrC family molybdoenzyme membrane anchor subunit [Thermoproteota archaeon]